MTQPSGLDSFPKDGGEVSKITAVSVPIFVSLRERDVVKMPTQLQFGSCCLKSKEERGAHDNDAAERHHNLACCARGGWASTGAGLGGSSAGAGIARAGGRALLVATRGATLRSLGSAAGGREGGGGGLSGGLGGSAAGGALVIIDGLTVVDNLDALPGAAAIRVLVLGGLLSATATHEVLDLDALVVGVEGSVGEVGKAAGPLDGTGLVALLSGDPGSQLDTHGGLGVSSAAREALGEQGADDLAVDDPLQLLARPLEGVGVVLGQGASDGREAAAVVRSVAALAKVVGLDLGVVAANPLPVDLVEIVRLEHDAGHDTGTGGRLHRDIDLAEEDVLIALGGRRVGGRLDAVDGAVAVVLDLGAIEVLDEVGGALGEVVVDDLGAECLGEGAV